MDSDVSTGAEASRGDAARFRDFALVAADLLWETDAGGRFAWLSVPERRALRNLVQGWHGRELASLDEFGAEDTGDCLAASLAAGREFRGVRITLGDRGQDRVLELAGIPRHDVMHRFLGYRGVGRDVTEAARAAARIRWLAEHDAPTGLANREHFNQILRAQIATGERHNRRFGVLLVDLDGFKKINDTYGHAAGDRIIRTVAERLQASIRLSDVGARIGGDEFAMLQTDLAAHGDAVALARRLIEAFDAPIDIGDRRVAVKASCGIAVYPEDGREPDALLHAADVALYRAKAAGGDDALFFVPHMDREVTQRRRLERDLRTAIAQDQLSIDFQPQFRLCDRQPVAVEALLRWRRSVGDVAAGLCVSVAEEYGHIHALGTWVLRHACSIAAEWVASGHPDLRLAVNLSHLELRRDELADEVLAIAEEVGLAPRNLELELAERALIISGDRLPRTLGRLTEAGVAVAIDDVGCGQIDLALLEALPVARLKIDRSIVHGLPDDGRAERMCRSLIAVGHCYGHELVAEGIETEAQLALLQALGCERGQGHLLATPLDAETCAEFLGMPDRRGRAARRS